MAKKKKDDVVAEVFTNEGDIAAAELAAVVAEAEPPPDPDDVRVYVPPTPEPPVAPPVVEETARQKWCREAGHAVEVWDRGDSVSPGEWVRLVKQGMGFVG